MNVRAGALFLMKTNASLSQEVLQSLKETWKLIPCNWLEVLLALLNGSTKTDLYQKNKFESRVSYQIGKHEEMREEKFR